MFYRLETCQTNPHQTHQSPVNPTEPVQFGKTAETRRFPESISTPPAPVVGTTGPTRRFPSILMESLSRKSSPKDYEKAKGTRSLLAPSLGHPSLCFSLALLKSFPRPSR